MKHHWRENTLQQVVSLLTEALRPLVEMQVSTALHRTDNKIAQRPTIKLRSETGQVATLRLVPWQAHVEPESGGGKRLWILQKSTHRIQEDLRRRDESFVDTSGAVRLHLPGILIDRTDLKMPALKGISQVRNPYSDKNSFVVRYLLELQKGQTATIQEIANRARISLASASYVVRALEHSHLVVTKRDAKGLLVSLPDPVPLITEWASRYEWTKNSQIGFSAPIGSPDRFLPRLEKLLREHRWALTLQAGAAQLTRHATWERIHLYLDLHDPDEVYQLAKHLGWEETKDANLTVLLPYYKKSVWEGTQIKDGYPIVSTVQLILDLWHYPVRGREQALHLLETQFRKGSSR